MSDRALTRRLPANIPRWGFVKGVLTGAIIEVPAIATAVWLAARLGVGDRDAAFMHVMRMSAVFAGIAALLTAGGIGRLAAYASVDKQGGRWRAVWVATRAHAAATIGLVIIAAIPLGHLPATRTSALLWLPIVGGAIGAACGAIVGAVCGGITPIGIADVLGLARRPTDALRQLLDPEDLLKLGAAMRSRTSQLFEGMFEPAAGPPETPAEPAKPKSDTPNDPPPTPPGEKATR
jgi:hypothetical protein